MRERRMSPRWLGVAAGQVRLEDRGGGRTRVRVRAWGLSPGFHGFHIHAVGACDPNAVDPATGRVTPFFSAGGHHNPAATSHPAHGGAVIVHALPDNYANIPARYASAQGGAPGPDADTLKTGDSGGRVVCGVVNGR